MENYVERLPALPEEQVIQDHHNDLQEAIIHPLTVASKLLQEGVVSRTLVSEVSTQGRSQLQNSTAIITAVTASIHSKPDQFQVFMSVLEDSPESAYLARRMRNELSSLKPAPERLMERKGWYTVSAEYKRDFIHLQGSFGRVFDSMCETVKSQVPVDTLKRYLCRTFSEFEILLQDATTTDDVMKTVRNNSSLTDLAYFEQIAYHFDLKQVKQIIEEYHASLKLFCQQTLDKHSYIRSFREDYPRYILSSNRITFKLQWKANQKTLKDIRDVLQMSFRHLADRVQIVVIEDGSVVVVCCAPRYLMEKLVRLVSESVHRLADMGVVKLTIGGSEVAILQARSSIHQFREWAAFHNTRFLSPRRPSSLVQSPPSSLYQGSRMTAPQVPKLHSDLAGLLIDDDKYSKITHHRLLRPRGMVISKEGHLIVVERSAHCIFIFNTASGEVIKQFGQCGSEQGEFKYPEGVSLVPDGSHIIVADTCNHRLQVLTVEGAFVAAVGSMGSQPLQFKQPCDVAINHNDRKVFITEEYNHRVQVLNPDLSYSHCFGSYGDQPGKLYYPRGIAIGQDGMVYVSDYGNHRIQKFTPEGNILAVFDNKKSKVAFSPHGLCVDNNNILHVADRENGVVCSFDSSSGQFLGYISDAGSGTGVDGPQFVVSDKNRLYISKYSQIIICKL